jgi:hypothetical protein
MPGFATPRPIEREYRTILDNSPMPDLHGRYGSHREHRERQGSRADVDADGQDQKARLGLVVTSDRPFDVGAGMTESLTRQPQWHLSAGAFAM